MRKSIFAKIGAAAVVLTLVTSSLVGGTFAKYVTNASAKANVKVANWQVAFKQGDTVLGSDTEINLEGKADSGSLLPGDKGKIDINIYGADSEVGFKYTIQLAASGDDATGIKFYSDDTYSTEITADGLTDTVSYSTTSADMNKTVSIYWSLPAGADDAADTARAGKTATYTITMLAEQVTPTN